MNRFDLLHRIASLTEDSTGDPEIFIPLSRNDVFIDCFPGNHFINMMRSMFNETLRDLRNRGHVVLTRTTVEITADGFDEAWS